MWRWADPELGHDEGGITQRRRGYCGLAGDVPTLNTDRSTH